MRLSRGDLPDLSRSIGGVVLALGAVVLLTRGEHNGWGHLVRLLIVLVPAAVLYMLAVGRLGGVDHLRTSDSVSGAERVRGRAAEPWRSP